LQSSAIARIAKKMNIQILSPKKLDDECYTKLKNIHADLFIIVAYGKILPRKFVDLPTLGTFNLHFSLLPKYRGASPVQSALLSGDKTSGFTIFQLVEKMDAGDIFVQEAVELDEKNAREAFKEMTLRGSEALLKFCELRGDGHEFHTLEQSESEATYCTKFTKEDGRIFPKKETAEEIMRKYRALYLWPGIFYIDEKSGKRIKIVEAEQTDAPLSGTSVFFKEEGKCFLQTAYGNLEIIRAQPEGKSIMTGIEFWNWWSQQ
jgi:methionyl-tRNA formyltransferase